MHTRSSKRDLLSPDNHKCIQLTSDEFLSIRKLQKHKSIMIAERNAYIDSLLETLTAMMETGFLCDTQLVLTDSTARAVHWAVISNLRPQLDQMFKTTAVGNYSWLKSTVDLTPTGLDVLIQLAYSGRVQVTMSNIQDVVTVSLYLQMYDILKQCELFLIDQLSVTNCIELALFSKMYSLKSLELGSLKFVIRNFTAVVQNNPDYLTRLEGVDLTFLLGHDRLDAPYEEDLFGAVLKWIDHDPSSRRHYFPTLISKIRMGLIRPSFLSSEIIPHPYVKSMSRDGLEVAFNYEETKNKPRIPRSIIVALLGWSGGGTTPMIEGYDPRAKKWFYIHQRSKFLVSRAYHGAVALGQFIYIVGGFDGHLCYNTVVVFDTATFEWTERNPMFEYRCYVSVVVKDGQLYAMGGFNGDKRCRSCEKFDPERNEWKFVQSMNERRSDASGALHRGRIFMCGGFNGTYVLITSEVYDPDVNEWTFISTMINPRSGHELVSFNGHLYAIAGFNGAVRLQAVERYDEVQGKWVLSIPIINPRSNFAVAVLEDNLYVIGGFNGTTTFPSVEMLEAGQHAWKEVAGLCIHRSALAVCVLKDLESADYYHANASTLTITDAAENSSLTVHECMGNESFTSNAD